MRLANEQETGILRLRQSGMTYTQIAAQAKVSKGVVAAALYRFRLGRIVLPVVVRPDRGGCRWVEGDPRQEWHWCGAPVPGEGAWCPEHRRVVYQRRIIDDPGRTARA